MNRSPEKITILDLYHCIEGEINIIDCPVERLICPFNVCLMGNIIPKLTAEFRDFMKYKHLSNYIAK